VKTNVTTPDGRDSPDDPMANSLAQCEFARSRK